MKISQKQKYFAKVALKYQINPKKISQVGNFGKSGHTACLVPYGKCMKLLFYLSFI